MTSVRKLVLFLLAATGIFSLLSTAQAQPSWGMTKYEPTDNAVLSNANPQSFEWATHEGIFANVMSVRLTIRDENNQIVHRKRITDFDTYCDEMRCHFTLKKSLAPGSYTWSIGLKFKGRKIEEGSPSPFKVVAIPSTALFSRHAW